MQEYKTVSYSQTTITELMIPSYSNFGGKIHGGIILSLMDKVAYVCAAKHADAYCVTASIDTVDFLARWKWGSWYPYWHLSIMWEIPRWWWGSR